jgi:hypothetical protein
VCRFHSAQALSFDDGVLRVRVVELLEGAPDGLIGRPLQVRPESRKFEVVIEQVGHFQVRPEPVGSLSARRERLHEFLYREHGTEFHAQHAWGAETLASPRLPHGASVVHYVVYAENYVVDVLASQEPTVTEVKDAAV